MPRGHSIAASRRKTQPLQLKAGPPSRASVIVCALPWLPSVLVQESQLKTNRLPFGGKLVQVVHVCSAEKTMLSGVSAQQGCHHGNQQCMPSHAVIPLDFFGTDNNVQGSAVL